MRYEVTDVAEQSHKADPMIKMLFLGDGALVVARNDLAR